MPFHFCPQCGMKLQPDFRFCPSCGDKLPSSPDEAGLKISAVSLKDETKTAETNSSPPSTLTSPVRKTPSPLSPRSSLRRTRKTQEQETPAKPTEPSSSPVKNDKTKVQGVGSQTSDKKKQIGTVKAKPEAGSPPAVKSPRQVRGKGKLLSPVKNEAAAAAAAGRIASDETATEESKTERSVSFKFLSKSVFAPEARSKTTAVTGGWSKSKKAKHASSPEPLPEGEQLTDQLGKTWKLIKLIDQNMIELLYEVAQPNSEEADHILKLGAKDGRIFNEQNFLQRAAKSASVEKWIKQNKLDFLGIPTCVGFGLHADLYRFLIFPDMGCSLQSILEEENELLSEKAVLQLACRILDVLEFIHSKEYVHADVNAENIYVKSGQKSEVYLGGYCHAFRYCPGGQHVEYRESSRMPHEGAMEFISLDTHKGAAPSRRSDLQSLGYCMLLWHTGTLPWSELHHPKLVTAEKQRYMKDVRALLRDSFGKREVSGAFQSFLTAVMSLQYTEEPNYSKLKSELSAALQQLGGSVEQPLNLPICK